MSVAIVVFLRTPQLGKVKSRLAQTMGDEQALSIYRDLVKVTLDHLEKINVPVYLYFHPQAEMSFLRSPYWVSRIQSEGDLGQKMESAFNEVLREYNRVILIGSDCPYMEPPILEAAMLNLMKHDVVIGPASDGGYYLLGLKEVAHVIFQDIEWGTNKVLEQTISKVKESGWTYHLLPVLDDIDEESDWVKYKRFLTSGE